MVEFVAVGTHINELDDELSGMSDRVGWLETSLSCPGTSKLEPCKCPNGYTLFNDDCIKSDQTAAKIWMDEFNEEIVSKYFFAKIYIDSETSFEESFDNYLKAFKNMFTPVMKLISFMKPTSPSVIMHK